jgi:ribonuclease HI
MNYILYCDGATLGSNPSKKTGVGIICYSTNPKKEVFNHYQSFGFGTNNISEYKSLILGLEMSLENGIGDIKVCMDSQLVIKQCKKEWKIKDSNLKILNEKVFELSKKFNSIEFCWIPREQNIIADNLSKLALQK